MANVIINFIDFNNALIEADAVITNMSNISSYTNVSNLTVSIVDNSTFTIKVDKPLYNTFYQTIEVYDYDIEIFITLIEVECKTELYNRCCSADYFIIDNPCSNQKHIYKASSSPNKLEVYRNDKLIGKGNIITIPDYMICDSPFTIRNEDLNDCCCNPIEYPPCEEERTISFPCLPCLCKPDFSFNTEYCYDKVSPYIDFETTKFFNEERWLIIIDNEVEFRLNNICVFRELDVFTQSIYDYDKISYRRGVNITINVISNDGIVLYTETFILPDDFTDEQYTSFIDLLFVNYTFVEEGKYKISALVEAHCETYTIEKEILVVTDIQLYVTQECKKYEYIICNDTYTIEIKDFIKDELIVTINVTNGVPTYVFSNLYTRYNNKVVNIENKLLLDIDDGIYAIKFDNGVEIKTFIVTHICKIKECYLNLSKELYCNEGVENFSYMYSVISFYMLYQLIVEYYNLISPISIFNTNLSNTENLRYIEIDKAIKKAMEICAGCNSNINTSSENKLCCQ